MNYAIFLRGINTGGLTIKMSELKTVLQPLAFEKIQTILATGNLLIQTTLPADAALQQVIDCLSAHFQTPISGLIRTESEVRELLHDIVTDVPATHNQMVLFTNAELYPELVAEFETFPHDAYECLKKTSGHDLLWVVKKGETTKNFGGKVLGKAKYKPLLTSRNLTTIRKIVAAFDNF
ncbi:DUF1697 domain-containing protein [Enterococcus massiliensis]|uniref:DUF1697 domain-containing protein n=1 Tax=Enterococcus massiliensis TaxID=1640685 RepID=UPI00065E749F|nr:DUF1697 domain-containing protein [Enterococcus massiliensis]